MAAGEAAGRTPGAEAGLQCARRLARLLVFGDAAARPAAFPADSCAGDPESLSVPEVVAAPGGERPGREAVARKTLAACRLAAEWQARLDERGVRALPVGGVAHMGSLYRDPADRLVATAGLLVSPYDAARARVVLAAGGLVGAGEVGGRSATFHTAGPPLVVRWALHPPGWSSLPTSPFFEETVSGEAPYPPKLMGPAASWAAHRLILASGLWRPGTWSPLELAESAVLGTRVDDEERRRWTVMVHRWGVGRLWRRADELERWLLGARRPDWLVETLARAGQLPGWREGLLLQDSPARAGLFLLRWSLLRLKH